MQEADSHRDGRVKSAPIVAFLAQRSIQGSEMQQTSRVQNRLDLIASRELHSKANFPFEALVVLKGRLVLERLSQHQLAFRPVRTCADMVQYQSTLVSE